MPESRMKFAIEAVTPDDIPYLADLSNDAFRRDRHTQMKVTAAAVPYDMGAAMREDLARNLHSRKMMCIKAVVTEADGEGEDTEPGTVVGWSCWAFRSFEAEEVDQIEPLRPPIAQDDINAELPETATSPEDNASANTSQSGQDTSLLRLNALQNEDMQRWMRILMPPDSTARCMIIVGLYVATAFQSRGVGSAMLRWGAAVADRFDAYTWVHSSEAGWRAFSKFGFQVVGSLEVDLDEWAPRGPQVEVEGEGAKWGKYTFRYMKRLPGGAVEP